LRILRNPSIAEDVEAEDLAEPAAVRVDRDDAPSLGIDPLDERAKATDERDPSSVR
jgi:hypothetical protein